MMCLTLNEESPATAYHLASLAKQGVVGRLGCGGVWGGGAKTKTEGDRWDGVGLASGR